LRKEEREGYMSLRRSGRERRDWGGREGRGGGTERGREGGGESRKGKRYNENMSVREVKKGESRQNGREGGGREGEREEGKKRREAREGGREGWMEDVCMRTFIAGERELSRAYWMD
jgi:hypothetical protein